MTKQRMLGLPVVVTEDAPSITSPGVIEMRQFDQVFVNSRGLTIRGRPLTTVRLDPGDVLVVHVTGGLDYDTEARIRRDLRELFPENKAMFVTDEVRLTVDTAEDTETTC